VGRATSFGIRASARGAVRAAGGWVSLLVCFPPSLQPHIGATAARASIGPVRKHRTLEIGS
jgi:hypothetical protein